MAQQDLDKAPNEHGVSISFQDDLEQWHWEHEDKVADISARAVRTFLRELGRECDLVIFPSDNGARVVLTAWGGDLHIEADLGQMLRDFAANSAWHSSEMAAFKRVLRDVLKVKSDDTQA